MITRSSQRIFNPMRYTGTLHPMKQMILIKNLTSKIRNKNICGHDMNTFYFLVHKGGIYDRVIQLVLIYIYIYDKYIYIYITGGGYYPLTFRRLLLSRPPTLHVCNTPCMLCLANIYYSIPLTSDIFSKVEQQSHVCMQTDSRSGGAESRIMKQ